MEVKRILLILCVLLFGCQQQYSPIVPDKEIIDDLINLHNQHRISKGLLSLKNDPELTQAAQEWAENMASKRKLYHGGYKNIGDEEGVWTSLGENIASGQKTQQRVFECWLESSGHRANIENNKYRYIGCGMAEDKYGEKYWCVIFGNKFCMGA